MSFNESWRQIWHLDRQSTSSSWTPRWWIAALFQRPHVKCWPTTWQIQFCQNWPDLGLPSREKSNWKVVKMEIDQARGESCHRRHHTFDPTFDPPSMLPPVPERVPTSAIITFSFEMKIPQISLLCISLHWNGSTGKYSWKYSNIDEHETTECLGSVLDQTLPPSSPLLLSVACHQLQVRLYKLALSNFRENHFIQGRDLFPLSATP